MNAEKFSKSNEYRVSADRYAGKKNWAGFAFIPVSEIVQNVKPPEWLINGLIEQQTMALIFGDPETGKSFISIDMTCCITTETPYYGHEVKQGAVFYIAGEGHNGLGRRFAAWAIHNDASLDNAPLYVAHRPAQLYDENHAYEVAEAIQQLADENGQEPCMIVIDTLARNFGGGDENSTQDMSIFIQHVDELKNRWNASALIVHHTGHADKSRARGAIALSGALDHEYKVSMQDDIITMENTKQKEGPPPDPLYFQLCRVPVPHNYGDDPLQGAALKTTDQHPEQNKKKELKGQKKRARDTLVNCLAEYGETAKPKKDMPEVKVVRLDDFKQAISAENIINSDNPDSKRRAILRLITDLENLGIIRTYEDYVWLADNPDNSGRTTI